MEGNDQFCLRWNDFQSKLSSGFHSLLQENLLMDVTLGAGGQFVHAHKVILAVCSSYFKELFTVNPCKHPIVLLKDVEMKNLEAIIEFMYNGEVNVTQSDLPAFLQTAEMLKISGLTEHNEKQNTVAQELFKRSPAKDLLPKPNQSFCTSNISTNKKRSCSEVNVKANSSSTVPRKQRCVENNSYPTPEHTSHSKEICDSFSSVPVKQEVASIDIIDLDEDVGSEKGSFSCVTTDNLPGMNFTDDDSQEVDEKHLIERNITGEASTQESSQDDQDDPSADRSQDGIQFVYSKKGRQQLVYNGYIYRRDRTKWNNESTWRCTKCDHHSCKARGILYENGSFSLIVPIHNHPQQHSEITMKKFLTACRK